MGHFLSLDAPTRRISYICTHIYTHIYIHYNFAATAAAAQPWTWCNVRNTLPPRRGLTRSTAIPIGLDAPLANAMCLAYYRHAWPILCLHGANLVALFPSSLVLPHISTLSFSFFFSVFAVRLRREHRVWRNETPTAALITNDRNLNEPGTHSQANSSVVAGVSRRGPEAPGSFTYCENCSAQVLRELVSFIEDRPLSKRLINDFIVRFSAVSYIDAADRWM